MKQFESISEELVSLVGEWEPILEKLSRESYAYVRNSQNRSIKQILGHMVDSASNNTHRVIHLQYEPSPLIFPDYANFGNNDRWIAIQNSRKRTGTTWLNYGDTSTCISHMCF